MFSQGLLIGKSSFQAKKNVRKKSLETLSKSSKVTNLVFNCQFFPKATKHIFLYQSPTYTKQ